MACHCLLFIVQLIIDECAMSPEPQSMVPIIATQAQQVVLIGDHKQLRPIIKCQPAAELGLDQSLFERLFLKFPAYTIFLRIQYRMVSDEHILEGDVHIMHPAPPSMDLLNSTH